jgi:3',5'-cyclic AMP phosphodiesterase CpdA
MRRDRRTDVRTVVHLSDLHFGRVDQQVVEGVGESVRALAPDLVAISGDLTQRARREQFGAARTFLATLPQPQLVVPGNHDVPLYNMVARVLDPLGGYRRQVTRNLRPQFVDDEIAVFGADTTRSFTIKHGGIPGSEVRRIAAAAAALPEGIVKVVVGHHPFDTPVPPVWLRRGRTGEAVIEALARSGVDVFLTGHLHVSYTGHSAGRYSVAGRSAIVVEAGTATSVRQRGEVNAFNVLRITTSRIIVERHEWNAAARQFAVADAQQFDASADGWVPAGRP